MKNRCPSEQNTRVIRINVGAYQLLMELSRRSNISIAEAFDLAITEQSKREQVTKVSPAQLPMRTFHFEPKNISSDGVKHIKLKSIRGV